ncbi:hypothetical protein GCM10009613_61400 [Pseudonocardia kongjuensis]|uniref:Uncharacterized protein n=1 Tax=Pseudonocardia kongjuensis TaxID=102227 RepID=A0ABP4J2A2_9PSEU
MATLETRLQELAQTMGTGDKALRVLLNGNAADLAALATTDKTSLVNALNEIYALIATAAGIDDASTSTSTTWSSTKTRSEIDTARAGAVADAIDDGAPSSSTAWSSSKTAAEIDTAVSGVIDDGATTATDSTLSAATILAAVAAAKAEAKSELIGGAGAEYDTLVEIQNLLQGNDTALGAINAALAARVRFDQAQSLTGTQQNTARSNIGAVAAADIGNPDRDLVAIYTAALQ